MKDLYTDGFFSVDATNGFLPKSAPLAKLPIEYNDLQHIIDGLPSIIKVKDQIVSYVEKLPNYKELVEKELDVFVIQALYRAYSFVTSAYLLEKSYHEFLISGNYGKARNILPRQVAEPFNVVATKLNSKMWMDYHYSYSLGNYVKKDSTKTLDWKNLDMACRFTDGPDEVGFIMVHVYINEISPRLIESIGQIRKATDNEQMNLGLGNNLETMVEMNKRRREMWHASRHEHYNDFRIFIMGVKGNESIFDDGVHYEGVFDKPVAYRGQTGAQDDIIPTQDILTGVINYYPDNELTKYLLDLREYRPQCVQEFFSDLQQEFKDKPLLEKLDKNNNWEGLILLHNIVNEIYNFRNGHWQFVQKYIMSNTKYAFATGGTPITTWLINQIEACLKIKQVILQLLESKYSSVDISELKLQYTNKTTLLEKQVNELANINYNVKLIHDLNLQLNLDDQKSFN